MYSKHISYARRKGTAASKKLKRNATRNSQSVHFHSRIPLTVLFSKPPPLAVAVDFISKALHIQKKRIITFQLISQKKHNLPLFGKVSRAIFTVTMDVPAGEEIQCHTWYYFERKNIHVFFMNIIQIKDIGNAFLKYSQKTDYCSSCGWVQFTNIFLPNNTHLPVLTFIYQQKTCTKEIQVALRACFCWVVFLFWSFFSMYAWKWRLYCVYEWTYEREHVCTCMHTNKYELLNQKICFLIC